MSHARRILVGQIWHEGHSFNPVVTVREDVSIIEGEAMLRSARDSRTSLSGIVAVCDALGDRCVPTLAARSRPGGPIAESVFQEIADALVAAATKGGFDAICLDMHGATLAQETGDTEGLILTRIREAVGPDVPIAVALDLHGYITPAMLRAATIVTGYRTTPHQDIYETGERAMRLLDRVIREGTPRAVASRLPFITRGNDETDHGPLLALGAMADRWRSRPEILDVSVFNIHPFLDLPEIGQVVVAYDDGSGVAQEACREIAEQLWSDRALFQEQLPSVEDAFEMARQSDRVIALGDQGDRVVGAGPGDSPYIAAKALEHAPDLKIATGIFDPEAVKAAQAAGVGATLEMGVGASISPNLEPLHATWQVKSLPHARFRNQGPYMHGVEADFGPAAILTNGNLSVVVTTRAPNIHDPAFYDALNIAVADQDIVVARAANHYKLSFRDCARCMTVDTPGLTAFRPQDFSFTRARPFYPLDEVEWTFERTVTFYGDARS